MEKPKPILSPERKAKIEEQVRAGMMANIAYIEIGGLWFPLIIGGCQTEKPADLDRVKVLAPLGPNEDGFILTVIDPEEPGVTTAFTKEQFLASYGKARPA